MALLFMGSPEPPCAKRACQTRPNQSWSRETRCRQSARLAHDHRESDVSTWSLLRCSPFWALLPQAIVTVYQVSEAANATSVKQPVSCCPQSIARRILPHKVIVRQDPWRLGCARLAAWFPLPSHVPCAHVCFLRSERLQHCSVLI